MPFPQASPDRLTAPPSAQVGRYAIVRRLAVGGMAEVYLARARGPHGFARQVVLKRIRPELARTGQFRRMFADEARVAAHLQHVNIAHVLDVGDEDGEPYLVMEYVEGHDVHALLKDAGGRGLPIHVAAAIGLGVAAGLDHAHRRRDAEGRPLGIVHRDVSPSNVMVAFDGNVKLLDFGVAKAQGAREVTRAGTVKGKVEYMSPEQALGLPVDQRSDLFSLGTLLHELLIGSRPFDDSPVLVPPGRQRAGIPPALDALVVRLLAHEPARRPASAEEVSGALDAIARNERLSSSPVALRRYLIERFGEPDTSAVEEAVLADRPATATATASVSVSAPETATAEVTAIDSVVTGAQLVVAAPRASGGRRLLLLALAAAGAIALVPILATDRESRAEAPPALPPPASATTAPAPVVVSLPVPAPVPAAVPTPEPLPEAAAEPEPEREAEPEAEIDFEPEAAAQPRPARRAAPRRRTPVKSKPAAAPPADWDPDSPLLRSQERRFRP